MIVHKFGGTSLGSAERFGGVADIVLGDRGPAREAAQPSDGRGLATGAVVVASAMNGVTDQLIAGARAAEDWGIPDFVRDAGRSYTEIAHTGHLMMLEEPAAFCRTVDAIIASA